MIAKSKRDSFRICYYALNPKFMDGFRVELENKLKLLPKTKLQPIVGLDDARISPCDLLVIGAQTLAAEGFSAWLHRVKKKMHSQLSILVPTLIIAQVEFETLASMLEEAVADNWYFDIVSPDHLDSLPIRVSNLLRVHDHLHELARYDTELAALEREVHAIRDKLSEH